MKRSILIIYAFSLVLFGQTQDAHWRTVGAGVLASKPTHCASKKDVYICIGTGCASDGIYYYCTATDTWSLGSGGGGGTQVNSDWNANSGVAQILNKPSIPSPQVNSDWNAVGGIARILNKPTLGGAAALNVGNVGGTVAAGDDLRFGTAEQTVNKGAPFGYAGLNNLAKLNPSLLCTGANGSRVVRDDGVCIDLGSSIQTLNFLSPTLGPPEELHSLDWAQTSDGIGTGCASWNVNPVCFPNVDFLFMNFFFRHGMQDYNNDTKTSTNMILARLSAPGAGQRGGFSSQIYADGVGDVQGFNCLIRGGGINSAGDEGDHCLRVDMDNIKNVVSRTLLTMPAQSSCGSGGLTLTSSVVASTVAQTFAVTGSTAGCTIGDRIIINRSAPIQGTSIEEAVTLTGVTSGTLSGVISHRHPSSAPITPSTKLDVGPFNAAGLGELRWIRNISTYTTGTISSISGAVLQGSGTSWGSQTVFSGDSIEPCMISLDSDTNTGQASGLRSWFFCASLNTGSQQITLTGTYTGASTGGTYKASCGAVIVGFEPNPLNPQDMGRYIYVDTPPTMNCFNSGNSIEEVVWINTTSVGGQAVMGSYLKGNPKNLTGWSVHNLGDNEANHAFIATAIPFVFTDPSTPAYVDGVFIGAPVENGFVVQSVKNVLLGTTSWPGYPGIIGWGCTGGSLGCADIHPDTTTGDLWFKSYSAKFHFESTSNGNDNGTIDFSGNTSSRIYTTPNYGGRLLLDADVPINTMTRTLPTAATSYVMLGTWVGNSQFSPRAFTVYAETGGVTKIYNFSQYYGDPTHYTWARIIPSNAEIDPTQDTWDLEFAGDDGAGHQVGLRLRRLSGSTSLDVNLSVYCYAASTLACGFTPSTATGTSGSWGTTKNSSVIQQSGSVATVFGNLKVTTDTTGAGTVAGFGTNSPAITLTGPYTWIKLLSNDGSTVYVPAYK